MGLGLHATPDDSEDRGDSLFLVLLLFGHLLQQLLPVALLPPLLGHVPLRRPW